MIVAQFDKQKAYVAQEDVFYDDGREIELIHFVYSHPKLEEIRRSPKGVLEIIDEFARTKKYLMSVGEDKGATVAKLIAQAKPKIMVELGSYVGYSCILFGDAFRKAGGTRYYSLERNPEFAAVTTLLVDLAGLSDTVKVIVGPSDTSIKRLHSSSELSRVDMLFLDHHKPLHLPDLKLCEQLGLIVPGTLVAADNVIKPGNPPYVDYVRSSLAKKQENLGSWRPDDKVRGDPNLVYESELIKGFEPSGVPDGVEVTRCAGRQGGQQG
ncbi:catechol O-methyltransferase [Podospora didyma]|uniref:catechol O-methyltransferase n=1 Tax=Podospora didyma TaxID=330526 RepID=A0AAE0KDG8_9PEZI|nr:catechol O-methyltransferase [Podospora didyma]